MSGSSQWKINPGLAPANVANVPIGLALNFQMSPKGQQLQGRFVEAYADRLHDQIKDDLELPASAPVARPGVSGIDDVRSRRPRASTSASNPIPAVDPSEIGNEVRSVQSGGRARIDQSRGKLDASTRSVTGANEEAADQVKDW